MALEKITQVTGRGVFVPGDDIDTDRIIPARFMKCVTFDGFTHWMILVSQEQQSCSRDPTSAAAVLVNMPPSHFIVSVCVRS